MAVGMEAGRLKNSARLLGRNTGLLCSPSQPAVGVGSSPMAAAIMAVINTMAAAAIIVTV